MHFLGENQELIIILKTLQLPDHTPWGNQKSSGKKLDKKYVARHHRSIALVVVMCVA